LFFDKGVEYENDNIKFEGEFKNNEYWNGKGKQKKILVILILNKKV